MNTEYDDITARIAEQSRATLSQRCSAPSHPHCSRESPGHTRALIAAHPTEGPKLEGSCVATQCSPGEDYQNDNDFGRKRSKVANAQPRAEQVSSIQDRIDADMSLRCH